MIGIDIDRTRLEAAITAHKANWLARAAGAANTVADRGSFHKDDPSLWSEIKSVYRRMQNDKCAYCERWLAGMEAGSAEHDVEHYRPKKRVTQWKKTKDGHRVAFPFPLSTGHREGYPWLAYDCANYVTACKPCNSALKANKFPIFGSPGAPDQTVEALQHSELPALVFPLLGWDDNPEAIIAFDGMTAVPNASASEFQKKRARVTIEFFMLNRRTELQRGRADVIKKVYRAVEAIHTAATPASRDDAQDDLDTYTLASHEHANCARCYRTVCETDPVRAYQLFRNARSVYQSTAKGYR